MINDQAGLDAYLNKMRPKIEQAAEAANAKPPRISVSKVDGGELLSISKSGLGKPLNILLNGNTVKFWRKDPNKIEFEGHSRKDLLLNHQYAGIASPWGLGAVVVALNTKEKHITSDFQAGWWTFKEDMSENDVNTFAAFKKKHQLVGSLFNKHCDGYLKYFDDRSYALNMQAGNGKLKKVKKLIEYGFHPDAGDNGETPLLQAIHEYDKDEKQADVIRFLLSLGANPNSFSYEDSRKGRGETALFLMFDKIEDTDEMELMKLLLEHGADPNRKNSNGDTVLHIVAINGEEYWPVAKLLMEYGANPNLKGEDKLTALEIAEKEGDKKMVETLRGF